MLTNQKVLVVGASSGIGRAVALAFAREGARVMVSARRESRLRQLQQELAGEGHEIAIHAADAGSRQQLEELHRATVAAIFCPRDLFCADADDRAAAAAATKTILWSRVTVRGSL